MKKIRIIDLIAISLTILTFTPLVIPTGRITPIVMGLPYSFWTATLIGIALTVCTYLASIIQRWNDHDH